MSVEKTLQSTVSTIHMGLDGFVWWVGVVEDRNDPLHLGRARVRIHAWHTDDKTLIPTEHLPWAHPMHPVNGTHGQIVPPKEGTMVMGFFMDGKEAEHPVLMGIFNGIPEKTPDAAKGFSDPGKDVANRPAPPGQQPARYPVDVNEPTNPRIARNENVTGDGKTYLDVRDITRVTVTTAKKLIPDVSGLAKSITIPGIPGLSALSSIVAQAESVAAAVEAEAAGLLDSVTGEITGAISGAISQVEAAASGIVSDVTGAIDGAISDATAEAEAAASAALSDAASALSDIAGGFSIPTDLPPDVQNAVSALGVDKLASFTSTSKPVWQEPKAPYDAKYPYNNATQTESGHVMEVDDSPGAERIHTRHRTGTYQEMQPDGSMVTHVFGNNYHIVAKDENVTISGVCNITVNGDANLYVKKNLRQVVSGDAVMEFGKNLKIKVKEKLTIENGGDFVHGSTGKQTWSATKYDFK